MLKTDNEKIKFIFTGIALILLVLHLFWPNLGIDLVSIALLFLAAIPWIGPMLKGLRTYGVKNIELPGGIKIELEDIKSATDKVIKGYGEVTLPLLKLEAVGTISEPIQINIEERIGIDDMAYIRQSASTDSNLSLVAFRIALEKRLKKLADLLNLKAQKVALSELIRQLQNMQILSPDMASGLMALTGFGNQAAHGAGVSEDAAAWVKDFAASIILDLDTIISKVSAYSKPSQ